MGKGGLLMFEVIEDIYLGEGTFLCPHCGAKNWYYIDELIILNSCIDCHQQMHPRARELSKDQNYRILYHFKGKVVEDGKETPKVYSCRYSPY